MTTPPFIVNRLPAADSVNVGLTQAIRLSVKDDDTYVVASQLRVTIGYAQIHADGTAKYDDVLPRTSRASTLPGTVDTNDQPTIIISGGIQITKTVNSPQQSTYFTKIDAGAGFKNVLATAIVTPVVNNSQPGAVFGIENGPRDTGVYIIFDKVAGINRTRMCGPADHLGNPSPNITLSPAWSGTERFTLVWNELRGMVELYVVASGTTTLLHEEPISSFALYDPLPGATPHIGGAGDMTLVYGVEGATGERVTFGNVAITTDVGFPVFGSIRPGDYATLRSSDEAVRYLGGNPVTANVAPWFGPDSTFFTSPDPLGTIKVISTGGVVLAKNTSGDTMAIYREEPGLLNSGSVGFMIEGNLTGTPTQVVSGSVTGMGVMVYDGQTVYYLGLLAGTPRSMGILLKGGLIDKAASYQPIAIDWSTAGSYFRLAVDPLRAKINVWGSDILSPILTLAFNRSLYPSGADFGLGSNPFIAFGHLSALATTGLFELDRLTYECKYTAYEGIDNILPDAGATPNWTRG